MSKILVDKVVLEQALEALEQSETFVSYEGFGMARREAERKHQAAITALRGALAEPVQEPDDEVCDGLRGGMCIHQDPNQCKPEIDCPAFSAPPQRKPLTEEQKLDLVTNWFSEDWAIEKALDLLDDYDIECARVIGE